MGLYLGLTRGNDAVKNMIKDRRLRYKAMLFPSMFALFCVNILLKIFVIVQHLFLELLRFVKKVSLFSIRNLLI